MKAFPSNGFYERTTGGEQPQKLEPIMGMDLRDYFAAQSISALLQYITNREQDLDYPDFKAIAEDSYSIADAMMEARKNDN